MVKSSLDDVLRPFIWSMNILAQGNWPDRDWLGRPMETPRELPLASGYKGVLANVRGDWAFYCELCGFPQWNCNDRMCWLCRASGTPGPLCWNKFADDAEWRDTLFTHGSYLRHLRVEGSSLPVLFGIIGLRLECFTIDVLHAVDQGVTSHLIANVLWIMVVVRACLGGRNQKERVELLIAHLNAWYKDVHCKSKVQGKLNVDRLRTKGGWPKLKAKAAATRHMTHYALYIMVNFGSAETNDRCMLALCQLMVRFYELISSHSRTFPRAVIDEIKQIGQDFSNIYANLAADAYQNGEKLWKLHPKLHLWVHLTVWGIEVWGNPRFYWTYSDEDLVGIMARAAKSVHSSNLVFSVLFKWLHGVFDCAE